MTSIAFPLEEYAFNPTHAKWLTMGKTEFMKAYGKDVLAKYNVPSTEEIAELSDADDKEEEEEEEINLVDTKDEMDIDEEAGIYLQISECAGVFYRRHGNLFAYEGTNDPHRPLNLRLPEAYLELQVVKWYAGSRRMPAHRAGATGHQDMAAMQDTGAQWEVQEELVVGRCIGGCKGSTGSAVAIHDRGMVGPSEVDGCTLLLAGAMRDTGGEVDAQAKGCEWTMWSTYLAVPSPS
ncbi:hypothetical protein B0H14DRAFT_2601021 [Mycena olivaceomarginata]|nr:hypothetical protein B0H14DRAFT_2601021 [Mycena olivaceomarginata]